MYNYMLCTTIFIWVTIKVKGQLKIFFVVNSQATISLDALGQLKSKQIIAKMSTIIKSMQCSNKKFSVKILTADEYNVCAIFVATYILPCVLLIVLYIHSHTMHTCGCITSYLTTCSCCTHVEN